MSDKVTAYIEKKGEGWKKDVLLQLRDTLLRCDAEEGVKWGVPTYMNNGNVVSFAAFKNHIALWFYQGAFLKDDAGILIAADSKTEGLRQMRFGEGDALNLELIKRYADEAIENSKKGKKIAQKVQTEQDELPALFESALSKDPKAAEQFAAMSLSKRNEYIRHIAGAKREDTQVRRIEQALEYIRQGFDLHHKYRK